MNCKAIWNIALTVVLGIVGLVIGLLLLLVVWVSVGYVFYLLEVTPFSVVLLLAMVILFRLHAAHAWGLGIDDENEIPNFFFLIVFVSIAFQISKIFIDL